MRNSKSRYLLVAAAFAAWLYAVPATAVTRPDAWITAKTKLALLTTEGVSGTAIHVDTVMGQVTLHGKAASSAEKDKAESVAKSIDGVQSVRNLVQVVSASANDAVQVADDQLKEQVGKALKANRSLSDSSITVQSVNNGVVLLGGKAASVTDHLQAVTTAANQRGVRRVASEVVSPDQLSDAEIWRERNQPGGADDTVAGTATDMWITTAAKMRLLADSKTPALDINVDTDNGQVILFGMVPSETAKAAAEAEVRKVSGVKTVRNELQVVAKPQQEAVKARDEEVADAINTRFENHESLKNVDVDVKNGVVQLKGTVPSATDRLAAAVVARSTPGVHAVNDHLRIAH